MRFKRILLAAASALFAMTTTASAQTATRTLNTTVTVDVALIGAAVRDLDFTRMAPGIPKSVTAQDAQSCADACTSGKWWFQNISNKGGDRNANLLFTALPDSLTGPGGAKLGVSYNATACVYARATNTSIGCVSQPTLTQGGSVVVPINKAGGIGYTTPATPRDIYLWLGGTASPRAGQRAGTYVGVVTVIYFYN
jgi:hypothetical protein